MLEWLKKTIIKTSKAPSVVGLDIGSSTIKLLQLKRVYASYQVVGYAIERLTPADTMTAAIQRLLSSYVSSAKDVAIAIPDTAVICKIIQLDAALNENEMESHVLLALDQHISYSLEEVSLDFQCIGANANNAAYVDVLLVAAHKVKVDGLVAAITAAGLRVVLVDVESFALARACALLTKPAVTVLVNLGATTTTCIVLHNNAIIFTHSEIIDAAPFTLEAITQRINFCLQTFLATQQYIAIEQMFLSGGGALLSDLTTHLTAELHIPVTLANPFTNMLFAPTVDKTALLTVAPQLFQCCALCINPLPLQGGRLGWG